MNIRLGIAAIAAAATVTGAQAGITTSAFYGWEDGGLALGGYNNDNMSYSNNANLDYVYDGARSLQLTEDPSAGTPQTFVAFITGLQDGDTIDASFFAWDDTEGASPSLRIWGSYATSDDITNYSGSAGGSSAYSSGTPDAPWSECMHSWTFDSDGGERDALVVQIRFYAAGAGDTLWADDLNVDVFSASDNIVINTPMIPAPGALALLGVAGLAGRRRRK